MSNYNLHDYYARRAKQENFLSRAVYKLQEIDQRFNLLKTGQTVLELGAAPGSWTQYVLPKIGTKGDILSLDLQKNEVRANNLVTLIADILAGNLEQLIDKTGFKSGEVLLSDLAPKTTGIKLQDQIGSLELAHRSYELAQRYLRTDGHFVCKIFQSQEMEELTAKIKTSFDQTYLFRPKATRKNSTEIYIIGQGWIN